MAAADCRYRLGRFNIELLEAPLALLADRFQILAADQFTTITTLNLQIAKWGITIRRCQLDRRGAPQKEKGIKEALTHQITPVTEGGNGLCLDKPLLLQLFNQWFGRQFKQWGSRKENKATGGVQHGVNYA